MENQEKEKLGRIFFHTLQKLIKRRNRLDQRLLEYQFDVFQSVIIDLTGTEKLLFNTLFARIAYLGIQCKLSATFLYELHLYRKEVHHRQVFSSYEEIFQLGLYVLMRLIRDQYNIVMPEDLLKQLKPPEYERRDPKLNKYEPSLKGMISGYDAGRGLFVFIPKSFPDQKLMVSPLRLDLFQSTLVVLREWAQSDQLPVTVILREIGIDKEGYLYPKWIVLEPDYLVDVTAIAECFAPNGARPEYYFLKKFIPTENSKYLLIGNIVNHILDRLIHEPDLTFDNFLGQLFKLTPLGLTILEDKQLLEIIHTVKEHYQNLLRVLGEDFPRLELDTRQCVVEPSFYAPELGLQGRLDVLHQPRKEQTSIIELKSGSPFRENRYGLSANHYTQTLLYDLMIRSVYGLRKKPLNYILYSKLPHQNLRFAPTIQAAQMEALTIRNEIYVLERKLIDQQSADGLFHKIKLVNFPGTYGFLKDEIERFEKVYAQMDAFEKAYFGKMAQFVAREHHLSKTGLLNHRQNNGMAALWLEPVELKEERFSIFSHLEIEVNDSMQEPPLIKLRRTDHTNELANFRVGDIVVLRPMKEEQLDQLKAQVVRASLIELTRDFLVIKLRSKQYDQSFFGRFNSWRLEPDFLDSGFRKMYESLYSFAKSDEEHRKLLLGRTAPGEEKREPIISNKDLTENQQIVLDKLIAAPDYFLLWGPPGTGKTSVMMAAAVEWLLKNTDQQILLLAYTNRAVDEICSMLEGISESFGAYIRVGSKYATGEPYRHRLLDYQLNELDTRIKLREKLTNTRVFTATTSSMAGKTELFSLKKFDVVFIDEASQILEPMIIGLLGHFRKFVLIGDHMQLPAVVVQSGDHALIEEEDLHTAGFSDVRMAFFERLYNRCVKQQWNWAIGQLYEQGRMHKEIMHFPSKYFYGGALRILPGMKRLSNAVPGFLPANTPKDHMLLAGRMLFINVEGDKSMELAKNNPEESKILIKLIQQILQLFSDKSDKPDLKAIGVITPFRAQIAQIRYDMARAEMDPDLLTIDTVERYQGGARDIIIYSTVVNAEKRLQQIQAPDQNGIDRKLNVAVTRAKEHFILLGNKTILSSNELYRRLIENCREISL